MHTSVAVYITPWITVLLQTAILVREVKKIPLHFKDLTIYFCVHINLPLGLILNEMILPYTFVPF
jgi:hypothetical protein